MAKRNVEKTVVGTFVPAVRETVKGVARTAEEIASLKKAGQVENVLWVGTSARTYKQLESAIRPALDIFAKAVIDATKGKNKHATIERFREHVMEAVRMVEWQLPRKEVEARPVDSGIDF